MITDARALRPVFLPAELHHRDGELTHLSSCLQPIRRGLSGENALITGSSGTGKTTLARYTVGQLERATLDVRTGYVNCLSDSSRTGAMHTLLRDAGLGMDLPRDATSTSQYLARVRQLDDHAVFVLDEVDVLADRDLLVALYEEPNVTMLMVCVDEDDFLASANNRLQSRIRSASKLRLDKYRHAELVDIIRGRVEAGLRRGVADEATISRIADLAAGDARFGIALLRRAAERAESEGRDALSPGLVEAVTDDAETEVHERNIRRLSTHKRILFEIVREAGEIAAGELHAEYEKRAQIPKSKPTRRRYLQSLERYELVEQVGQRRGTCYKYFQPENLP